MNLEMNPRWKYEIEELQHLPQCREIETVKEIEIVKEIENVNVTEIEIGSVKEICGMREETSQLHNMMADTHFFNLLWIILGKAQN